MSGILPMYRCVDKSPDFFHGQDCASRFNNLTVWSLTPELAIATQKDDFPVLLFLRQ